MKLQIKVIDNMTRTLLIFPDIFNLKMLLFILAFVHISLLTLF